jgi:aconitate hydratase
MGTVGPSLAGPKRPQDRVSLQNMKSSFYLALSETFNKSLHNNKIDKSEARIGQDKLSTKEVNPKVELNHGSVVIAAITSCTNTSNPSVMIAAGLIARKALEKGLLTKPWVKTSFAPGSRVVTEYLQKAGLMRDLEAQRFNLVGYGCTTCIGNSGPLSEQIDKKIQKDDLVVAAVLSGNRNFEGRIHSSVRANYLASPPLVVVYALAGRIDIDFDSEPIGQDKNDQPIYLKDIWPSQEEVSKMMKSALDAKVYKEKYSQVFEGDKHWRSLQIEGGELFDWDPDSSYIKNPPFFNKLSKEKPKLQNIKGARVIALLGDTVTTDHISPAGTIPHDSPAGKYLISKGVEVKDFNSFGSRRGNHEVMMRGTFGNIRIKNKLLDNVEGGYTIYFPTGEQKYIYDASIEYQKNDISLIVFAGEEYGTGSSRDWAAKGTYLLGIKAVIAESFERIHRSNLVGMGVLPLQFHSGDNFQKLGLTGRESYDITGIEEDLHPGTEITITAIGEENVKTTFNVKARLDTPIDVEYYKNGGILQTVVRQMIMNT